MGKFMKPIAREKRLSRCITKRDEQIMVQIEKYFAAPQYAKEITYEPSSGLSGQNILKLYLTAFEAVSDTVVPFQQIALA